MASTTPSAGERELLENLFEGVYYVDRERRITYWNRAAERISGFASDEVVGRRCLDGVLMHVDDAGSSLCHGACPLLRTMMDGRPREVHVFLHHREGHRVPVSVRTAPIYDANRTVVGAVEVFREGGGEPADRTQLEQLRLWAQTDELTGVANRRALDLQVKARLEDFERFGWPFGVILVDLDYFKTINDSHGHAAGDRTLQVVARTLAAAVRKADVVGRWGGEEFMILAPMVRGTELAAMAGRVRALVASSRIRLEDSEFGVTASLGATLARGGEIAAALMRRVDELLYASKQAGRDRVTCDPADLGDDEETAPPPGG